MKVAAVVNGHHEGSGSDGVADSPGQSIKGVGVNPADLIVIERQTSDLAEAIESLFSESADIIVVQVQVVQVAQGGYGRCWYFR